MATYKDAGVDLDLYRQSMARLPPLLHRTFTPRVMPLDGGFAGLFQLDFANHLFARNYRNPVLVSCTDGVGTKLKVAQLAGRHNTVGIDLVAMSVNDALCCGAEPLFFLDYVAMSHDDPPLLEQIVQGISAGCLEADCALLGGETAIMPDLYARGDYDLAGFCVGAVERDQALTGNRVAAGDVILGLASSGVHSNGFSLVRRLAADRGWKLDRPALFDQDVLLIEALLAPTRIYVKSLLPLVRSGQVRAMAHITGGGLLENIPRVLPDDLHAHVDADGWQQPRLMAFLQAQGNIEPEEMARTFNCGIGMAVIVAESDVANVTAALEAAGETVLQVGRIAQGAKGCTVKGSTETWSARADWSATHLG